MVKSYKKASKSKLPLRGGFKLPQKFRPFLFVLALALVGAVIIFAARAATTARITLEAESGQRSGNASAITDTTAAAGSAVTFTSGSGPSTEKLFAAHHPGGVLTGFAAPNGGTLPRPIWADAFNILKGSPGEPKYRADFKVSERRLFDSTTVNKADLDRALSIAEQYDLTMVHSFKYSPSQWDDFARGTFDSHMQIVTDRAKAQRTANGGTGRPWVEAINHEPDGDGSPATEADNLAQLASWASMQQQWMRWLAGYRRDAQGNLTVYTQAQDVRDMVTLGTIGNGHWWSMRHAGNTAHPERAAAAYPQYLIDDLANLGGIAGADFYDPNEPHTSTTQRTWLKMEAFTLWMRQRGAKALFCGEFSTTDAAGVYNVWDYVRKQRNGDANGKGVWTIMNYFNSMANSRWDWRLIPDSYPASTYQSDKDPPLLDEGGTPVTEQRMINMRQVFYEATWVTNGGTVTPTSAAR